MYYKSYNVVNNSFFNILITLFLLILAQTLKCESNRIEINTIEMIKPEVEKIRPPEQEIKTIFTNNQKPKIVNQVISSEEILSKHFQADINCTFKEALSNEIINKSFIKQKWKVIKNKIAIPAKNHKVVFQNLRGNSYVFKVKSNRSLITSINSLNQQADQYYKYPTVQTPYFLVQYNNREIPTYLPDLTLKLLSEWENVWIKENNVTKEYFDKHILVYNVRYKFWDEIDIDSPFSFIIEYYFEVDWAKAHLKDYYVLPKFEHPKLKSKQTKIALINKIDEVVSMNYVVEKVSAISDSIYMNVNNTTLHYKKRNIHDDMKTKSRNEILKLRQQPLKGRLIIEFQGNYDFKNNRRLMGKIYLDTGEMEVNKKAGIVIY